MALGPVGLPGTQLPTCCSVHGPESPLGLGLTLIRPPNCPFARPELPWNSPLPQNTKVTPSPEYGFGNCLGFQGSALNCSCHGGGLESRPDPSLKPYLLVFSRQALPSRLQASSSCAALLADSSQLEVRASCSGPLHPTPPTQLLWTVPALPLLSLLCLENLWSVGDPQPGPRGKEAGTAVSASP